MENRAHSEFIQSQQSSDVPQLSQRKLKSPGLSGQPEGEKNPKQQNPAKASNHSLYLPLVRLIWGALMNPHSQTSAGYLFTGKQAHHSTHPKAFRGIFKHLKHSWIFILWFYPGLNRSLCNLNISFVLLWIYLPYSIVMVANAAVTLMQSGCTALIIPLFGLFYDSFKWLRTAQRWLNCIISHGQQVHVNKP